VEFDARLANGGTVESAEVWVEGAGAGASLTITGSDCESVDGGISYWQVDFGPGEVREPPSYWPDDLMAALGNSENGVTQNPSLLRDRDDDQLGGLNIGDFRFDDEDAPTEVFLEFDVLGGEDDPRPVHFAVFELPGPFELAEVEEQVLRNSSTRVINEGGTVGWWLDIPQDLVS
jgi:hypothetical protein